MVNFNPYHKNFRLLYVIYDNEASKLYHQYEVYRGYIVFVFSVIMFFCLSVCLFVNFFFRQRFLSNYLG